MKITLSNGIEKDASEIDNNAPDSSVVKVLKTIKSLESQGNYNAVGDSGRSHGAYQWLDNNWKTAAKETLGDENAPMTPDNQDFVAYQQINNYKKAGRTPEEIDALWNGAHKDKTTGLYVHNNPERATKFRNELTKHITQPTTQEIPLEQLQPKETSLGEELGQRGEDISTGIKSLVGGKDLTGQNRFSGLLQTVGGVAGGIGDITGKALELVPGVKQVENLLGQGVGALAKTPAGQSVVKAISDFTTEHPELSKDIGAGFNIVTAIPILKGLGVVKDVALDATSAALKNVAEKSMTSDLTEAVGRTITGKRLLQKEGFDSIKTLVNERAIPEIIGNKYSTKEAYNILSKRISEIENKELQPALAKAKSATGIQTSFISMKDIENDAIKLAQDQLKDTTPIKTYFERLRVKYGEFPPIDEINKAKRLVSKNISEAGFNSPTYTTDKIVRSSLQSAVEKGAKALGLPDVAEINQRMADLIKAQNILKQIEGKPIKTGFIGSTVKNAATAGGEMAGTATGIPFAGTLAGRQAGGFVGNKLSKTGLTEGILKRTGKEAVNVTRQELKKKLGGLFGGLATQKVIKSNQ